MRGVDVYERILAKVVIDEKGCWLYTGALVHGYACTSIKAKSFRAHRITYERNKGPIPEGRELDHTCRVRRCVNPDHLEAVTKSENLRRRPFHNQYDRAAHCVHGHAFTEENTYRQWNGGRGCRTCRRNYDKARRAQKREVVT